MSGLLKQPGYRLYAPDSREAGALLAEQGLSQADLNRALAHLERTEGVPVQPSSESTRTGCSDPHARAASRSADACKEPFVPLLGSRSRVLGRVPEGSTTRFLKDGTLPD